MSAKLLLRKFAMAGAALVFAAAPAAMLVAQDVSVTGRANIIKLEKSSARDNANVVVWLTPINTSNARLATPAPNQRLRLVQKDKTFEPHLVIVPVGSVVEFPNHDPFFHNVFSLFEGKRFDLGLYEAGGTRLVRFDRAGICYIFCNIHPEMSAVVVVLNTPYYAKSDRSGHLTIPQVPAGRYVLHAWYEGSSAEDLNALSREITISEVNASLGTLRIPETNDLRLAHKNKYGRDYDNPNPVNPAYERP